MFLFVFEFLGTTELMVILVVALIVFGPRKLPQLSRSLGKSLSEFRRASEDFKRTWEREVALEDIAKPTADAPPSALPPTVTPAENSIGRGQSYALPATAEAAPDNVFSDAGDATPITPITPSAEPAVTSAPAPAKRDWL